MTKKNAEKKAKRKRKEDEDEEKIQKEKEEEAEEGRINQENRDKKGGDDLSKGVSIPLLYHKRKCCPCCIPDERGGWNEDERGRVFESDNSRYRYFSDSFPSELEEHGVQKKEFVKVIKKVNKIWAPPREDFYCNYTPRPRRTPVLANMMQ